MTKVKPEWIKEWRKRRRKRETYYSIAKEYSVDQGTIIYHMNKNLREKVKKRAREYHEKKMSTLRVGEKRQPNFFLYRIKNPKIIKRRIVSRFRRVEKRDELRLFLYDLEPLFSLFLLKGPSTPSEMKKVNETFSQAFGVEPLIYTNIKNRLYNRSSKGVLERIPIPRFESIYKITNKGLKQNLNKDSSIQRDVLETLKDHPEGLPPNLLAVFFGIRRYGEAIPKPYSYFINRKYSMLYSSLILLTKKRLVAKRVLPRDKVINLFSSSYGIERRIITTDELTSQASKILALIQERGKIDAQYLSEEFNMSNTMARTYLSDLRTANLIEKGTGGVYYSRDDLLSKPPENTGYNITAK